MERPDSYTLAEVSQWVENKLVDLPTVQRGFVWKPSQIENLWDSLLRGYPVGSFVLSCGRGTDTSRATQLDLLDGQQRATAICLGFGNPAFRRSAESARIFIDLESPKLEDNRKYLFRAITKSHPWGYQSGDNSKPLDADAIRKALDLYGVRDHLDEPLDRFFPYDAVFPLPFELFLNTARNGAGERALLGSLENSPHWDAVVRLWKGKLERQTAGKKEVGLTTLEEVRKRILGIYDEVVRLLDVKEGRRIPALYLDFQAILSEGTRRQEEVGGAAAAGADGSSGDPREDEIETLFVRLNAGGTPLRGEELNYSILKAKLDPLMQEKVEKACAGLFTPARFITIAFRLFQLCRGKGARDAISMKIKPKQFQKTMTEEADAFGSFLAELVELEVQSGKTLLEYVKELLVYHERKNPAGLPYLVASRLSESAPEVMFMLLYRIKKIGDRFSPMTDPRLHRRMLGMVTLFAWFGKGEKLRDHARLLANVWPAALQDAAVFWSSATVQRAMLEGALPGLPALTQLEKVQTVLRPSKSDTWSRLEKASGVAASLLKRFFNNRELVLYAQRKALLDWFEERLYLMEDTNVPFDWDHIFPNRYVKGKKGVPRILRESYNTNGNFRAWPYPLNRGDQDVLPSVKLNPTPGNTEQYPELIKCWKEYFKRRPRIRVNMDDLAAQLLAWSGCGAGWTSTAITDVRKDYKQVYALILQRNVALCREWYREFHIDDLIPGPAQAQHFDTFLNSKKWGALPKRFADRFDSPDQYEFRVCSPLQAGASKLYLYLCYPGGDEELEENLAEDAVSFGVIDEAVDGVLSRVQVTAETAKTYQFYGGIAENNFTLVSGSEQHYLELFAQIHRWLHKFPRKDLRVLADHFLDSLITQYRKKVRQE